MRKLAPSTLLADATQLVEAVPDSALTRMPQAELRKFARQLGKAAARDLAGVLPGDVHPGKLLEFLEQVEYHGRRLAKRGHAPREVLDVLRAFRQAARPGPGYELLESAIAITLNNAWQEVREAEARVLAALLRADVESRTLEDLIARFLDVLKPWTRADEAHFEPGAKLARAVCRVKGEATSWRVPVGAGVLTFRFERKYQWLPQEKALLETVAERCRAAGEKTRLLEVLAERDRTVRNLATHLIEVEERERRRISRELHDETGQTLLCARLQLENVEREAAQARYLVESTIVEVRRLLSALSPEVLERYGLPAALRQLIQRIQQVRPISASLVAPEGIRLPGHIETVLYRLAQECLNNVLRHSQASRVKVSLQIMGQAADKTLRLVVEDNGVGFDPDKALTRAGGHALNAHGLRGMQERVTLLGGTMQVKSRPGLTRIEFLVPAGK